MSEPQLGAVIKDITADIQTIVRGEIELAKAELVPQAKRLGFGVGMFGAAGYLGFQAITLLFICIALTFSALYSMLSLGAWAYVLGFLTLGVLILIIVLMLVLIGKSKMHVDAPKRTLTASNLTIDAVADAIDQADANVKAITAGQPRTPTATVVGKDA